MKRAAKYLVLSLTLVLSFSLASAGAEKQKTAEIQKKASGLFEIRVAKGISYPMGDVGGTGNQKQCFSDSESFGIGLGYIFKNSHMVLAGLGLKEQTFEIERDYSSKTMVTSVDAKFYEADLSYRYQWTWFYAGAGFYMDLQRGKWLRRNSIDGEVTENSLYGQYDSMKKDCYGCTIYGGLTFPVNETLSLNAGIKISIPFTEAYNDPEVKDSIKTADASLQISALTRFKVPFLE